MKTLFTLTALFIVTASFSQSHHPGCLDSLKVPSSFSPNGDGMNETISIHFDCPPEDFNIKFFNRWGETVYESSDYRFSWDGRKDNQPLSSGTYIWLLNYTFNGAEVNKKGNITILR
ncbi:MAG: gliding motility-associated-like protein [Arenicella sp.]|jgi:gliding motility-associated-like protein